MVVLAAAIPVILAIISRLAQAGNSAGKSRVFELRIYTASPGKMEALQSRFRDHSTRFFAKHGMEVIGYWQAASGPNAENTFVYILAFPSKQAQKASWEAMIKDPEWQNVKKESERDGIPLAARIESRFLTPTEFSPMK
jgi:hypothetical protein